MASFLGTGLLEKLCAIFPHTGCHFFCTAQLPSAVLQAGIDKV